ncbi:GNAT family N-acetyltransferase [Parvicella tangerina]|uniref:N-acetyltransferase domain-containing protein n=1 Tax=Parvicella tangerina TaxID=2829795 RepID=A0A916NAH0_9FLAO|nr:GNAT family N-acetyltransferase [Parvicella tangerina]CAG5079137.1 hypothetical protein CRYO30217_00868 [Parvicella tangerina]
MSLILKQYGITLKRIAKDDIELVRTWRNHPSIRKTMAYQKKISAKEQVEWFERVNNSLNYYFLIIVKGSPIGVINCKEVNLKEQYGEGGIFIWEAEYINSPIPGIASIILINYIFNVIHIGNKSYIRILRNNEQAKKYNRSLGYSLIPGQNRNKNQWYILTREDFNSKKEKLMRGAKSYMQSTGELVVEGSVSVLNIPEVNDSIGKTFT